MYDLSDAVTGTVACRGTLQKLSSKMTLSVSVLVNDSYCFSVLVYVFLPSCVLCASMQMLFEEVSVAIFIKLSRVVLLRSGPWLLRLSEALMLTNGSGETS